MKEQRFLTDIKLRRLRHGRMQREHRVELGAALNREHAACGCKGRIAGGHDR